MNCTQQLKSRQLIEKIEFDFSEWIEMSDNPSDFVAGILANKVISLQEYIAFLEKRIQR